MRSARLVLGALGCAVIWTGACGFPTSGLSPFTGGAGHGGTTATTTATTHATTTTSGGGSGSAGGPGSSSSSTGCMSGTKLCMGMCVGTDDPMYGCGPTACSPCGTPANGTATCTSGMCAVGSCAQGYADCNGSFSDGCETQPATDVDNCGACGRACSSTNVATQVCAGGLCTPMCNPGYSDCTEPMAPSDDDGCETNTDGDVDNCGGCGRACSGDNVDTKTCQGGVCTSSCSSGYANCSQPTAPSDDDGCETNTTNDPQNCNGCGHRCPFNFTCSNSQCNCTDDASCKGGMPDSMSCSGGLCYCNGSSSACNPGQRCHSYGCGN